MSLCLQFGGQEEEGLKQAVATFCSNQPFALEMIKSRQKKDPKFLMFVQVIRISDFFGLLSLHPGLFKSMQPILGWLRKPISSQHTFSVFNVNKQVYKKAVNK